METLMWSLRSTGRAQPVKVEVIGERHANLGEGFEGIGR